MTGSQQNATGGTAFSDNMAGSGGGEDAILPDQHLLDPIRCTDLGYQLYDLGVVVTTISTNDEEAPLDALGYGEEDAGDEGFAVVWLLEDFDLFSKTRPGKKSVGWLDLGQLVVVDVQRHEMKKPYVPGF